MEQEAKKGRKKNESRKRKMERKEETLESLVKEGARRVAGAEVSIDSDSAS